MKYLLIALLAFVPVWARADDTSHRAAAAKLIELVNGREVMRSAFLSALDASISAQMKDQLASAEYKDTRQAMVDWFDQDFKWDELEVKFVDVYVKAFTEDELNQLTAFYQSPLGKKTLTQLPQVMNEAMQIGQVYAASKQDDLMSRLKSVHDKYHPASAPAPTPAPAATTPAK